MRLHTRAAAGAALAAALLLGIALSACGSGGNGGAVEALLEQAAAAATRGDFEQAQAALRDAEQLDPDSAETKLRLARVFERQGDGEQALPLFRAARELDPALAGAVLGEARQIANDDPDGAEELVRGVLESAPGSAEAHIALSRIALARGDGDEAERLARRAIELDPADPRAHVQHSYTLVRAARQSRETESGANGSPDASAPDPLATALAPLAEAERLYAERHDAWGAVSAAQTSAELLALHGERGDEAAATARRAVERARAEDARPLALSALAAAGKLGERIDDVDLRRWALEQRTQFDEEGLTPWLEWVLFEEEQEPGSGDAVFARLLEMHPDEPNVHVVYAGHLRRSGQPEKAYAHLESVLPNVVDPVPVLTVLARMHEEDGDHEAVEAVVDRLERDHPERPATRLLLARRALERGDPKETIRLLSLPGVGLEGSEPQRLMAYALIEVGEVRAASRIVRRALEADDEDVEFLRLRARVRSLLHDWEEVVVALGRVRKFGGSLGPADRLLLAAAHYEQGKSEAARRTLERQLAEEVPSIDAVLMFVRYEGEAQPDRARALLGAALERAPADERLLAARAALDRDPPVGTGPS